MPTKPSNNNNRYPIRSGITISFLGPDGSGKSTIISTLLQQQLPFKQNDCFHLKPLFKKDNTPNMVVDNPHAAAPYSALKSYVKLLFFIYQYNSGWFRNIVPLKRKKSLIIFDRYYDDLFVDSRRYRYGGSITVAKWLRYLIPRPELYFILTAHADTIYRRKKEVPFAELERQITEYRALADGKRYYSINVDRTPEEIVKEVKQVLITHRR